MNADRNWERNDQMNEIRVADLKEDFNIRMLTDPVAAPRVTK